MYNGVQIKEQETDEYKKGYLQGVIDSQVKKKVIKDITKMKSEQTEFQKDLVNMYGSFYFNFYKRINVDKQYLFRFLYICSFANYDDYLSNGRRLIREEELQCLLNLGKSEFFKTKKYLLENKLMFVENDFIKINTKYCKKGEINKNKSIEVVRMFDNAIQELYKNSLPREHKKLALLIEILPYINLKYNVVCYNPTEEELELIKPIKLSELCVILGYDKNNSSRLKKQLFGIKVNGEDVIGIFEKSCGKAIFINPRMYYKGGNKKELDMLKGMFVIK